MGWAYKLDKENKSIQNFGGEITWKSNYLED
jgi:hypothetical protein